ERLGLVAAAAGEGGDPPVRGVRGVLGVPGLVGAVEVAHPEVDDPHRSGSLWRAGQATAQSLGHVSPQSLNTLVGLVTTRSYMASCASSSADRNGVVQW